MPREPDRVQAHAELGGHEQTRSSPPASLGLVAGIVLLAASLVAIGAVVVLNGMGLLGRGSGQQAGPTPPPAKPTALVITNRQEPPTPTTTGDGASPGPSVLFPPNTSGGPLVSYPPTGSQPAQSGAEPAQPSPPATSEPSPGTATGPSTSTSASPATAGSPTTPGSPTDRLVADALARLTTDEDRVGQLLLLAWIGGTADEARPALRDLRAGGIVFVQNTSLGVEARAINQGLKQIADESGLLPPLTAIDHEGGMVQRIKDVPNLGNNWDFGMLRPTDVEACQRGLKHAQTLSGLGFTMNLAPVLDVNNNPANPVIGKRSYSDNPDLVARLGAAYIRGLQGGGVAAVGKHFPGHGNTSTDSHLGLPSLPQSVEELERIELVPFRRAIEAGVAGIMSAHIVFPAVDPSGAPATLSRNVMTGLLRERLNFTGLAISDDMGAMKAITDNYTPGDAAVRAIQGGVDMVIISAELPRQRQARDGLLAAVKSGEISPERLEQAVRNVLQVKARFGLLGGPPSTSTGCS